MSRRARVLLPISLLCALASSQASTQPKSASRVTTPRQQFGAGIGDDYFLATYTQLEQYWKRLDAESDRMSLVQIGRTEEGRAQWMAIVTAPENFRALDRYKKISQRLAHADGLTDEDARALAEEGKAIVWIDGGLHADEVLGAQQLIELVHQLVSRNDAETMRFLRDVIVLVVHANPDGHELVANWYMREQDPARRSLSGVPRLYQKYIGHDNNRDFYMSTQAETINMNRILYQEWFPQIVYNHHQPGPAGTVMFAPPFRGPFNYVFDPLIPVSIDLIAATIHSRFAVEGKPGVTMRSGSDYSTWWNGGLRTTAYFHNQIGLLTETIGGPTPLRIPFVAERQRPSADLPYPIAPQPWRFHQSIEYSITADRAVIDAASRNRETLLFNMYRMGKNSIERGSRDTWTASARRIASLRAGGGGAGASQLSPDDARDPALRDARGYIIPADQPDFPTATRFINALIGTGIVVHRATEPFAIGGKRYVAGSYVVKAAQAFRPHLLDMFEPQAHPDDIPFPGAPPTPPYDSAGWTLAYQMGVTFDRVLDAFDGPFERIAGLAATPPGAVTDAESAAGYLFSHDENDAFIAVNRLLAAGEDVYWLRAAHTVNGPARPGTMYVANRPSTLPILRKAAAEFGLRFSGVTVRPSGEALRLNPVRIGLWDRYGGSTESGWIRWLLERYEFPFEVVFPQTLDAGHLADRFDVLILPDGAIQAQGASPAVDNAPRLEFLPPQYRGWIGSVTIRKTIPQLKAFVEDGGTLMAIGSSTRVATDFGLPMSGAMVERPPAPDGTPLSREKYFVPGSLLRLTVDNATPLGYGMGKDVDVFFDNSPVFRLGSGAAAQGTTAVAWFGSATPLRSGWARGQEYLEGGVAVVDAPVGRGRVLLFGPEIVFRAQAHSTFKFLFNGIFYGPARPTRLSARADTN